MIRAKTRAAARDDVDSRSHPGGTAIHVFNNQPAQRCAGGSRQSSQARTDQHRHGNDKERRHVSQEAANRLRHDGDGTGTAQVIKENEYEVVRRNDSSPEEPSIPLDPEASDKSGTGSPLPAQHEVHAPRKCRQYEKSIHCPHR